jgi:hypothetical protein
MASRGAVMTRGGWELAVNELRCEANFADLDANVIATDRDLDVALAIEQALQLEHTLAWQDDLLQIARLAGKLHLTPGQPVPIGCHRAQRLAVGFQQRAVQVVAHVLLCHREVRLIDQAPAVVGADLQRVLRIDVFDDRKLARRQAREREAAAAAAQHHLLAFARQGYIGLLGQRAHDVEQLATRDGDLAGLLHADLSGGDQLDFQIRTGDAQLLLACTEQHIRENRHRLPSLNHADDAL